MNSFWIFLIAAPLVIQALASLVDEWVFHRMRTLGDWERIGHPLDTLFVVIPLSVAIFIEFSELYLLLFSILSLFSCVLVLKDEHIHYRQCTWHEQLVHSIMFQCHPLVFVSMGFAWAIRDRVLNLPTSWISLGHIASGMDLVFVFVCFHLIAQLLFWAPIRIGSTDYIE